MRKVLQTEVISRFMDEKTFESLIEDYNKHLFIKRNDNYEPDRHTIAEVTRYLNGEISITELTQVLDITLSKAYTTITRTSRWLKINGKKGGVDERHTTH